MSLGHETRPRLHFRVISLAGSLLAFIPNMMPNSYYQLDCRVQAVRHSARPRRGKIVGNVRQQRSCDKIVCYFRVKNLTSNSVN